MKGLFLSLLAILFILSGLAVVSVFRFDLEPFRPQIEQTLGLDLNAAIRIKKISLEKEFPPALAFEEVEFSDPISQRIWLKAERATGKIDLKKLLKDRRAGFKKFVLNSPALKIQRRRDGSFNFPGLNKSLTLEIRNGRMDYQDETGAPSFGLKFSYIDGAITPSADGIAIQLKMSFKNPEAPEMFLNASFSPADKTLFLTVKEVSGDWNVEGEIRFSENIRFKGVLDAHGLELEPWVPASARRHEFVTGLITTRLEGYGEGTHPAQIKRSLVLNGAIDLRDGTFHQLNLIKGVLAGLTPMPQFSNLLSMRLPGPEGKLLQSPDMPFDMIRAELHMGQGKVTLQEILVNHDAYVIEGDGIWSVADPSVDFSAKLVLMEGFSTILAGEAREFVPLRNAQGRIVLPFRYRGVLPNASVYPDLNFVAKHFFQQSSQELGESNPQVLSKFWESKRS